MKDANRTSITDIEPQRVEPKRELTQEELTLVLGGMMSRRAAEPSSCTNCCDCDCD